MWLVSFKSPHILFIDKPHQDDWIMDTLLSILIDHEGSEKSAYQDTLGYWTIGHGRLIDKRKNAGLSDEEMLYLLKNDVDSAKKELSQLDWYLSLDSVRQEVFIELVFNMGLEHLLEFIQTLKYVKLKDYKNAALQLGKSLWARQVKETRVKSIQKRLITGSYE